MWPLGYSSTFQYMRLFVWNRDLGFANQEHCFISSSGVTFRFGLMSLVQAVPAHNNLQIFRIEWRIPRSDFAILLILPPLNIFVDHLSNQLSEINSRGLSEVRLCFAGVAL